MMQMQKEYAKTAFIIPSCSAWFNIDTIHEIEMQSLPEYFCGKFPHKNPSTYIDQRNYIIKLYRESPNAYLSATVCRKNLPGDVCSIIRLHAFLELWGLINFNVEPHLKPAKIQLGASGSINPQLIDIASKGFIKVSEADALSKHYQKEDTTTNPSQNAYLIAAKKINVLSSQKRPMCNFCGNLCGNYWFSKKPALNSYQAKEDQAMKVAGESESIHNVLRNLTSTYVLCKECFTGGHYPKILSAFDFEKHSLETMLKAALYGINVENIDEEQKEIDEQEEWTHIDK
jgi:SWI/SNF related-matrix-associated actin-dependent regulator of chromatin subfamily C